MKQTSVLAVLAALSLGGAFAAVPEPVLLTPLIESNETQTAVIVYGTQGGAYQGNKKWEVPSAFDGDTSTYTDVLTDEVWGGVGFTKPVRVLKVRHYGRPGSYSASLVGALLQGANQSDFSDAVTVHAFQDETTRGGWHEETVKTALGLSSAFKYYRIYTCKTLGQGLNFADLAEVEFYGYDPEDVAQTVPATPTVPFVWLMNGSFCFTSTADANTTFIQVQRRWQGADTEDWRELASVAPTKTSAADYSVNTKVRRSADFRFRAVNATAVSGWTAVMSREQPPCLTGTYVGSTSQYSTFYGRNSFDGFPWNVSETTPASTAYAGLDFGEERLVTGLRYMTRYDQQADRAANIVFEIANKSDFSDAVAVYTTPSSSSAFTAKTVYAVTFDKPVKGRYGRYRSAVGKTFNLSEAEFDTVEAPTETPSKPAFYSVTDGGDKSHYHAKVTWYSNISTLPYELALMRAVSPNGPWTPIDVVESGKRTTEDTADVLGRTYYYSVAYKRTVGDEAFYGPVCATKLSYIPSGWLERDANDRTKLASGCTVLANGPSWMGYATGYAINAFDNDENTYSDLTKPNGCTTHKLGIDFGEPVRLVTCWLAPRKDQTMRINGLCLYGTQKSASDVDWMADAYGTRISDSTGGAMGSFYWKEVKSTSSDFYRSIYLGQTNLTAAAWCANLSELQFYGYPQNPKAMAVPSELAATVFPNHVALVWKDDAYATGWTVERRQGAKSLWVMLGTTSVPGFDDATAALDGSVYQYRVTAVNATEGAASAPFEVTATPVPGEVPWSGATAFPTDGRDGTYGIRWADTGDLKHFAMTFRFVRGAGATATSFVPVVRTSLVGGTAVKGTFAELPSEGWFRIERIRGIVRLYVKTSGGWTQVGESSDPALATGSVVVGAEAVGGENPLVGYTFSDATLEKTGPGLIIVVQ